MVVFHARDSAEVRSKHTSERDARVPGRSLIVTSGSVAWNCEPHNENTRSDIAKVYLDIFAEKIEHASALVLGSAMNEDSGFYIDSDTAKIELESATGELVLTVQIVLGRHAALNCFNYQVVAEVLPLSLSVRRLKSYLDSSHPCEQAKAAVDRLSYAFPQSDGENGWACGPHAHGLALSSRNDDN
jgi:hypothetical protein